MNIRDKLRNANIKLTDLSYYLGVSRPTMYHFLELYSTKRYLEIEKRIYDLLTFVDNTKPLNSVILINYMINNRIGQNLTSQNEKDNFMDRYSRLKSSQSNDDLLRIKLTHAIVMYDDTDEMIEPLIEFIEGLHIDQKEAFKIKYKNRGEKKNDRKSS